MAEVAVFDPEGSQQTVQMVHTNVVPGTSANAFPGTAQFEWLRSYLVRERTLYIYNTGAQPIRYKVTLRPVTPVVSARTATLPSHDGSSADNDIAAGGVAIINIWEACHAINVFIRSTNTGQPSTFEIVGVGHIMALIGG